MKNYHKLTLQGLVRVQPMSATQNNKNHFRTLSAPLAAQEQRLLKFAYIVRSGGRIRSCMPISLTNADRISCGSA